MVSWQPIDFHGIVTLNKRLIKELQDYIEIKETHLANVIIHSILPQKGEYHAPLLQPISGEKLTIAHAIDVLSDRIGEVSKTSANQALENDWQGTAAQINDGYWDYIELLEGIVTELFQQLDQIGFENRGDELFEVVDHIKSLLQLRLNQAFQSIGKIEALLRVYRQHCATPGKLCTKLKGLFHVHILDKDLGRNIIKSEKFLGFNYQTFLHRNEQFNLLKQSTDQSIKKFDGYLIFGEFEKSQKETFLLLYQWIRIWELNQTTKSLPDREPIRAIRRLQAPEKTVEFFKSYEKALRLALFNRSRFIKSEPNSLIDLISKIQNQHVVQGQMSELHALGTTVRKYRDFLLRTDPNPYIRSRLGFGEWIVGPEPAIAKELSQIIYEIEDLDELFISFLKSIEEGDVSKEQLNRYKSEIQRTLHEMTQPLASYSFMKQKGKLFVEELTKINELGSSHFEVVDLAGDSLCKALRSDWKFHVLQEIPEFHAIYRIHQGIVGSMEDRLHINRLQRFRKLINEIEDWVKNNDIHKHIDEIEIDISDLKGYLQDFLAYVQRLEKDIVDSNQLENHKLLVGVSNQLLMYRYLFGEFFHHLRRDRTEERVIRNQFLFVDQYFETIENKLQELRKKSL